MNTSYKDHIPNEEVRNWIKKAIDPFEDFLTTVKKTKLKRYGNIPRSTVLAERHSARKERQTEEEVGRWHLGEDWTNFVTSQRAEETYKVDGICQENICDAPTTACYGIEEEALLVPNCSKNDHISYVLLRSNVVIPWVITLGSQVQSDRPIQDHYYYVYYYNTWEHIQEESGVSGLTDQSGPQSITLCVVFQSVVWLNRSCLKLRPRRPTVSTNKPVRDTWNSSAWKVSVLLAHEWVVRLFVFILATCVQLFMLP